MLWIYIFHSYTVAIHKRFKCKWNLNIKSMLLIYIKSFKAKLSLFTTMVPLVRVEPDMK